MFDFPPLRLISNTGSLLTSRVRWVKSIGILFGQLGFGFPIPFVDQMRVKNTKKIRREQGEKARESEIARAEAANLAVQLRKV